MASNIWIFNHYATNSFYEKGGRHYWFAANLHKNGYNPTIFCANSRHNRTDIVDTDNKKYINKKTDNIPYVFIKVPAYKRNDIKRIFNMFSFYRNLFPVSKEYAKINGKPDVILASSVHPLTLVAGIQIAKKFGVPCICEVRDLWPESFAAYGIISKHNPIMKFLYEGEKWIYKQADAIIMTWEGGRQYIIDQGWDKHIDVNKVKHISNGVIVESFDDNYRQNIVVDSDFDGNGFKNVVYAGSIRKVNNLGLLLDAAKIIQERGNTNIKFSIYGSGDETELLIQRCRDENITNVVFKGRIEKKYVPYVLKNADINILHNSSTSLDKYGQSQNKLFEYLAAGKCIVQTYSTGYSIYEKYNCGISVPVQNAEEIAKAVIAVCFDDEMRELMGQNARQAVYDYDFDVLTNKLINLIESL
jgi:glycosyltransferase involved in cell wall biosynthesis